MTYDRGYNGPNGNSIETLNIMPPVGVVGNMGPANVAVQHLQPVIQLTNSAIINGSTLQRRNFSLDGMGSTRASNSTHADQTMMFHVYYTATSPLYYELMPFVRALKFANEVEAIKMLPSTWIKHVDDFNDPKFIQAHLPRNTKFIESQGVPMLCTITDSKTRANFMQKLYDVKLKKIENDRILENNRIIMDLSDQVAKLTKNHESHGALLNKIKDAFDIITGNHSSIIDNITKLVKDM